MSLILVLNVHNFSNLSNIYALYKLYIYKVIFKIIYCTKKRLFDNYLREINFLRHVPITLNLILGRDRPTKSIPT